MSAAFDLLARGLTEQLAQRGLEVTYHSRGASGAPPRDPVTGAVTEAFTDYSGIRVLPSQSDEARFQPRGTRSAETNVQTRRHVTLPFSVIPTGMVVRKGDAITFTAETGRWEIQHVRAHSAPAYVLVLSLT